MRNNAAGRVLLVHAVAGVSVVFLAWDYVVRTYRKRPTLLGFAIERSEIVAGEATNTRFLTGMKRFFGIDSDLPAGSHVPTSRHPIQTFQWGDYDVEEGRTYRYTVIPVNGTPETPRLTRNQATTVVISTEVAEPLTPDQYERRHAIYFNRGVAGSQGYRRKFGAVRPENEDPSSERMAWLSNGLFEALLHFIGIASGDEAHTYGLHAALYEIRYLPVGRAFAAARDAGAHVSILYENRTYKEENEGMIAATGIGDICTPLKNRAGIRHNKFIVLTKQGVPIAVWTGSTNISEGGIFGHSNVGHVIWDRQVAQHYLDYWLKIAEPDILRSVLVALSQAIQQTPEPGSLPHSGEILPLFSPRDSKANVKTLRWYADVMDSATRLLCMTFAFNLDPVFYQILLQEGDVLRYALFDKSIEADAAREIEAVKNTVMATGAKLAKGDFVNFLGEVLTGFNRNLYIHSKFMLVDPLGDNPIVVTGSANFSGPSQYNNDENMLVICGDKRVAEIYFCEFLRIFDHIYTRYLAAKIRSSGQAERRLVRSGQASQDSENPGYLKVKSGEWLPAHYWDQRKRLRRYYFTGA